METRLVFGPLAEAIADVDTARTVIVTDPLVRKLHGSSFPPCPVIEVERGEAAKSLAGAEGLWSRFLELGVDRGSTVLAVGGGSVTDLAGFAASTWMRGLDFGFVPTTLLAMVDASLGGKNGIDFHGLKNLVGTFTPPRFTRLDASLAHSLPDADFASGMAEAIKHALIEGEAHFAFLESRCPSRGAMADADLGECVRLSVACKTGIAGRDPRESGERRKLNLGHTFGHAVESVLALRHGEAVAVGIGAALELSVRRFGGDAAARDRVLSLLSSWRLPTTLGAALDRSPLPEKARPRGAALHKALAGALRADKKRQGGQVLFALPRAIGDVAIEPIPLDALCDFLEELP